MHFGFSYVGLIFMAMLFTPNIIWTKNQPQNYEKYASNENKILLLFERVGEVLVTCLMLIFKDLNFQIYFLAGLSSWLNHVVLYFQKYMHYFLFFLVFLKLVYQF